MEKLFDSPLLGVVIGAAVTYLLGRQSRRREMVDVLFDSAIAKVAILQASRLYPTDIASRTLPENDRESLALEMERDGHRLFVARASKCREALAALHPYCPGLRPYWEKFEIEPREVDDVIRMLQDCQRRRGLRKASRRAS